MEIRSRSKFFFAKFVQRVCDDSEYQGFFRGREFDELTEQIKSLPAEQQAKAKKDAQDRAEREAKYINSKVGFRSWYARFKKLGIGQTYEEIFYSDFETSVRFANVAIEVGE